MRNTGTPRNELALLLTLRLITFIPAEERSDERSIRVRSGGCIPDQLKKLHDAVAYEMPRAAHGLIPAWREILGIARLQKKDPAYQHVYELPRAAHA